VIIETTAAVTAIDVNTGPADPDTANAEALVAVARALRQRNIAGHILVDTIPTRRKAALPRVLGKLAADDPQPTRIAGLTPLGMIELTRQRRGLTLAEMLCDPDGRLSPETVALKALREAVRFGFKERATQVTIGCAPEVADVLAGPLAPARREAEELLKNAITVRAQSDYSRERIVVRS
jgi:Ribonuclease G/E